MDRHRRATPPEPAADEERAASARRRALREAGIVPIEPDPRVAVLLEPGERVLAHRRGIGVEMAGAGPPGVDERRVPADLYLTDRRLLGVGVDLDVPLDAIREADAADRRLLLRLGEGQGIAIRVADPALLRVEVAAARRERRRRVAMNPARPREGQPSAR